MTARTLPAAIETMRAAGHMSLSWAFEVVSEYGQTIRYCGGAIDTMLDGDLYTALPGMSVSSIAATLGMDVDNCIASVGDNGDVQLADVLDSIWDGAPYRLFMYDLLNPAAGIVPWHYGTIANAEPRVAAIDIEARDWRQAMHQDTTRIHEFACPWEVGDANCRKDMTAFTYTAAVTSIVSQWEFACSSLAQAADWFTKARLQFTSGENANGLTGQIWRQVRKHEVGGVLKLVRPLIRPLDIGDTIIIKAGCTHRPIEDCRDKFANLVNNGGARHKPAANELLTGELVDG